MLQLCDWLAPADAAHDEPPFEAAVLMLYERDCVPPPQVAEHEPQLPQLPTQLTAADWTVMYFEDK